MCATRFWPCLLATQSASFEHDLKVESILHAVASAAASNPPTKLRRAQPPVAFSIPEDVCWQADSRRSRSDLGEPLFFVLMLG